MGGLESFDLLLSRVGDLARCEGDFESPCRSGLGILRALAIPRFGGKSLALRWSFVLPSSWPDAGDAAHLLLIFSLQSIVF